MLRQVTLLSILGSHAVAVPLCPTFPPTELRYVVDQSQSKFLLYSKPLERTFKSVREGDLAQEPVTLEIEELSGGVSDNKGTHLEPVSGTDAGMILYTSGTKSRPVGYKPFVTSAA